MANQPKKPNSNNQNNKNQRNNNPRNNNPRNSNNPNSNKNAPSNRGSNLIVAVVFLVLIIVMISVIGGLFDQDSPVKLNYTDIINGIETDTENSISTINTKPTTGETNIGGYDITGKLKNGTEYVSQCPSNLALDRIIEAVDQRNSDNDPATTDIVYTHTAGSSYNFFNILMIILPVALIIGVIIFMAKSASGKNRGFDIGKSKARLNNNKTTTFKHVAGCEEEKEELAEIIDFLKNPKKYLEIGARLPKGVLLQGSPGTGKTLLARAVAGEAGVPFFSISGSDFVEMYVGLGASRVRTMFKNAKQNAPCILFIDEIDAVGRQRGAGVGGGNDEREQTLNQLLVEMDGFGKYSGVIVIAATNRPDVLDPALLRPGRFDRQITISTPDVKGRTEILKVHARNKRIAKGVTFLEIARRTPGFTGADLENLMNESALLCARENKKIIELYHIDEAVDRVMMGPAKKSRVFSQKERNFIAHHEAGHAVVGLKLKHANIVHKVTIIPRGRAGGYNLMLPEVEQSFLTTKTELEQNITGLLGGRVSEKIIFDEISTGAHNDIERATAIARSMVTEYGMSELGTIQYEKNTGSVFLGRDYTKDKNFSNEVAHQIDKAVRCIIDKCYDHAMVVINENIDLLKRIAHYLLEVDTLNKEDIDEIVETNSLKWWEDKLIENEKIKAEALKKAAEETTTDIPKSEKPAGDVE